MKTARTGMLEARAAGSKHFERGAKLKAQMQREAREEKATERKAMKQKASKEGLQGIVPEPTLQDPARALTRKKSVHFGERPEVEVAHPCCPDHSVHLEVV